MKRDESYVNARFSRKYDRQILLSLRLIILYKKHPIQGEFYLKEN